MVTMRLTERAGNLPEDAVFTDEPIEVIVIPKGMKSGRAALLFKVTLPNGGVIYARTTAKLFLQVADAIEEEYTLDSSLN